MSENEGKEILRKIRKESNQNSTEIFREQFEAIMETYRDAKFDEEIRRKIQENFKYLASIFENTYKELITFG